MMVIADKLDFPFQTSSAYVYKYIKHPNSIRATLAQLKSEMHNALLIANTAMHRIQSIAQQVPTHVKTAIKFAASTSDTMREWTITENMNVERVYHTASILANGYVLVTGGMKNDAALNSAELYNPLTGTWTTTENMNTARYYHTASILANGYVLVVGGWDGSTELYNPTTGTWTTIGNMNVARRDHTASTLANGYVLVTGGFNNNGGYLNSAELYNPSTGTWITTANMIAGRDSHTAATLANGSVLITGGYGEFGMLNSAELY
ncbi:unnamed protein product [Adineta steineri]|uniref:Uncharacterized protein n=1 Tax=Adineta steineri TaxID=433720 RepID=A0A815IQF2_9BILA|nr:unnamed protein product [Adineta steineri]CAF3842714.1 unnamed protein product [Adineta steineri]